MSNELKKWKQRQEVVQQLMDAALRVQEAITEEIHDFDAAVENWEKLKKRLDEL